MLKPIPRKVLIHSAVYTKVTSKDKWGAVVEAEETPAPISLTFVRIEPSSAIKLSKDNKEMQLKSILFYDCVNSLPTGVSFELEDTITFSGTDYIIASIDPISALSGIHHYEIGIS